MKYVTNNKLLHRISTTENEQKILRVIPKTSSTEKMKKKMEWINEKKCVGTF